jgi:hypothetical protein
MTYLVFYEGVLVTPQSETPIMQGFQLIQSLAIGNRIVLVTSGSRDRVDHQLRTERLQDRVADVIDKTVDLPPVALWQRQIEKARASWPVAYVVTSEPVVAEYAVEHDMVSLFFAHPGFSRPAQRPETGNRSWEDLVAELDRRWSGV